MGELADAVQAAGGHVTGIIPQQLIQKESAHRGIQDLIVVASMHQRKSQMADLSDGFIALPGGIGTLEGFFEILTWGQLGIHAKPCGILNIAGYFDALTAFLDHAVAEGFLTQAHRKTIMVESDAAGPARPSSGIRAADRDAAHGARASLASRRWGRGPRLRRGDGTPSGRCSSRHASLGCSIGGSGVD